MTAHIGNGPCAATVLNMSFDDIIGSLHRRDNLDHFVDGLVRAEISPSPQDRRGSVGSAYVPHTEVSIRSEKWNEMRDIELGKSITIQNGSPCVVHLAISLLPEEGIGSYMETVVEEEEDDGLASQSEHHRVLTLPQTRQIRSAMWARYEWIVDQVAHIKDLCEEQASGRVQDDVEDAAMADDDLSEEADPFDCDMEARAHCQGL